VLLGDFFIHCQFKIFLFHFFSFFPFCKCVVLSVHAHAVLKGANVEGIYDCNSRSNGMAFEHISYREAASRGPTSMDMMALTFCEENGIPG